MAWCTRLMLACIFILPITLFSQTGSPGGTGTANQICVTLKGNKTDGKYTQAHLVDYQLTVSDTTQPEIAAAAWTCNALGFPTCNYRAILRFDVSQIPSNAIITSARLYLYAKQNNIIGNPGSPTFGTQNTAILQKVVAPWNLATIAWGNQPGTTVAGQVSLSQSNSTVQDYQVDIPSFVQDWVQSPASNFGMMLKLQQEIFYNSLIFHSGSSPENVQPKLEICYRLENNGYPTGSDTTCSNGIAYFQKTYGSTREDLGYSITTTADSGYVVAGQTRSQGQGGVDGLVMKVNRLGTISWSKNLGGVEDDYFYRIRRTSDNGFILCGQTKSYGNNAGEAWLVRLDASGNLSWSKKYGEGSGVASIAFDVIQLSDGGFAFAGGTDFAPSSADAMITRTDAQGNVLWSRKYGSASTDYLYGLVEDGDAILGVGVFRQASLYDGSLIKVNKADGVMIWSQGYDADNRSTWFSKIEKTTIGYQILSLITDDFLDLNQQMAVWNLNTNGQVLNVRQLNIPGTKTNSSGWLPMVDGGFVAATNDINGEEGIIISKINATGNLNWARRYDRPGLNYLYSITASPQGGVAAVGLANLAPPAINGYADSSEILLMRFDEGGMAGSCSGINAAGVSIGQVSVSTSVISFNEEGAVLWGNPGISIGFNNLSLQTNISCSECELIVPPTTLDPVCSDGWVYFQRAFGSNKEEYVTSLVTTTDSAYVIAGYSRVIGNGGADGMLMKVSRSGQLLWTRSIGGALDDAFHQVRATSDNGFIACGQTRSYGHVTGAAWLVKFDASGNVVWSKQYNDGSTNGSMAFDVVQLSDGGYAFAGGWNFAPSTAEGMLTHTDAQGNIIWSRKYGRVSTDYLQGLVEDGDALVAVGLHINTSFYDGHILKVNKSDGTLVWTKSYDGDSRSTWFGKISKTTAGYQVVSLLTDNFLDLNQQQAVWNMDLNGDLLNARKLVIPGIKTNSAGWIPQPDGGFLSSNGDANGQEDVYLTKVNATGGLAWVKKKTMPGRQFLSALITDKEGGISGAGVHNPVPANADSAQVFLVKLDSLASGDSCAMAEAFGVSIAAVSAVVSNNPVGDSGPITWNSPAITVGAASPVFGSATLCYVCLQKPTGTERIRSTSGQGRQHGMRLFPNPVTGGPIKLSIDAAYEDQAIISIVDMYGNTLYVSNQKEVLNGLNTFTLTPPQRLQAMTNYVVTVRFKNHLQSLTFFVLTN